MFVGKYAHRVIRVREHSPTPSSTSSG